MNELIAIRSDRYEKIKKGLPEAMSSFLKELFNSRTINEKLMFVRNIQYSLDEWCSKYLFGIRMQYLDSLKKLTSLKETEIENKKKKENNEEMKNQLRESIKAETDQCTYLSKLLLDMSVGIESVFREIGEIFETTERNNQSLIKELNKCNEKLPKLAAALLMKGVAIELMDGDGLSVLTGWLEEVMKALEKSFKDTFNLKKDPKVFVLTVLGTQSTGKSTLLNTMFGVQFPVSAGRCTKGAFMQLIPIFIDNFPYDGLLIIDTEGLGAPEYKQDNTHDNEIATFVLGISDLAIMNVRGELPTNIENFLQVSTCALMRMSMVDFHPSVVFVHQNCDPSSKDKNLTGRHTFMKAMDEAVSTQARLIQKRHLFSCFQDVVEISLEDEKNDFVYFPQLLEGSPPMSPPSGDYSESCSNLTRYILSKMKANFEKYNNAQTLPEFSEKIKAVWNGVLEENFVLSLTNSAEIQVKYDIDNQMSNWKAKMESYMEDILEKLCGEIEADFKGKELTPGIWGAKKKELDIESHATNNEQKKNFIDHIDKQTLNQTMYKKWEQKCINKMDKIREYITEDCQRRLSDYYNHEKNGAKWRDELQQSKSKVQDLARQMAQELLRKKEKEAGENITPEFSNHEIEHKFQEFWGSVKDEFNSKKEKTFVPEKVPQKFVYEIGYKYGQVPSYKKVFNKFGEYLQNQFTIDWVKSSHVEFTGNMFSRNIKKHWSISEAEFFQNMQELIATAESRLLYDLIGLYEVRGLIKMNFQSDFAIFDCRALVRQYLAKAIDLLVETHEESRQKKLFNLTDRFKVMFLFYAAQLAIPKFEKAQQSFIEHMDISTKLDNERENIQQIFRLILKKEGNLTIAAKQVAKRLHQAIRNAVQKQVRAPCKDILLGLVTQKLHVHGLVLHDVIAMLENTISEENLNYLQEYFQNPFSVFRKKILHVFNGCPDIRLNDMIRQKFDNAVMKTKIFLEKELKVSEKKFLIKEICQNSYIRSLGVGEVDFDGIAMPKDNRKEAWKLVRMYAEPTKAVVGRMKNEVQKRMDDEVEIIEKLKYLISETDEINTDLSSYQMSEIKDKVINDINHHLFQCMKTCPLCHGPCNETHYGGVGPDSPHISHCHRPKGFAGYVALDGTDKFVTSFCNDSVKSNGTFRNVDTDWEDVPYKEYRTVNDYYKSWDIKGVTSDDSLHWKYITYQITKNLNRFFPQAKQPDLSIWGKISKSDAINSINSVFHLQGTRIAKNKDGFHYIKASGNHS